MNPTLGQWEIGVDDEGFPHIQVYDQDSNTILPVARLDTNTMEGYANAHLIKASKEMLEALKEVKELGADQRDPTGRVSGIVGRAIAKAEGG